MATLSPSVSALDSRRAVAPRRPRALLLLAMLALGAARVAAGEEDEDGGERRMASGSRRVGPPVEAAMRRAAGRGELDLRTLPNLPPRPRRERIEREPPYHVPELFGGMATPLDTGRNAVSVPGRNAPAPAPSQSFDGLDNANWGAGHPPDTVGDVGPTYYIQSINSSVGIYRKSDGVRVAAFSLDAFMSQGNFGNLCDTDNYGDPVVLYDTFEDRWVVTDFAFQLDASGNVINPPGAYQCFAVSKTGDPVSGGWNFYSINTAGGLGDYPKFGIWPDGLYMTTSMFDYAASGTFQNPRVYAFNKAQMYAGSPTVQVVSFDAPADDFTILPGNARLQTGTPPPGTPNYYVSSWQYLNALSVYKFHVDWGHVSLSTFTGPDTPLAASSWPIYDGQAGPAVHAPSKAGSSLETLVHRAMMQSQYSNLGGVESLWITHTVPRFDANGFAAPRWYQVNVTGGTVAANLPQAATWDPDGANVMYRFMPSLALDRMGNLALGYSTSSSTTKPAIKYAGRLATDPVNTFGKTEQVLVQGAGTQSGTDRWGDYSAMSLDPDGCTFWYTNEYYAVDGLDYLTRIGSFAYPECTPVGAGGTLSGTVTASVGGAAIAGATVTLGSRSTTTDGAGFYQFSSLPAGTYASLTVDAAGFGPASATSIVVTDGATTTRDFALAAAPTSSCPTDTTQADFQTGVPTNVDLTTSAGDVKLASPDQLDAQNTTLGTQGAAFTNTTWVAQTFTAVATGSVRSVELNLFSLDCASVTMPNVTVSIRNTASNVPTGADLAAATIPGFCSGGAGYFKATFASPVPVTSGTRYAIVWRAAAALPAGSPAPGYYATVSAGTGGTAVTNPYSGGRRASSTNSGGTWTGATGNANNDHGFKTWVNLGYATSGTLVSGSKDANPAAGYTPQWSTLSWTATTPASTSLKFQAAASNSVNGPFSFVGPDGTAATYFTTSGASLNQFDGFRYLQYKAYLGTTVSTSTPTLADVTTCFSNTAPPATVDLTLAKSDGGVSVAPGGTVVYTLTYANTGDTAASGVVLTDVVPANTTFAPGSSTAGWSCTPSNAAGSTCTLAVGALAAASGNQTASFAVTVASPIAAGTTQVANTASIADDGASGADPTPADNTASDTTPLTGAPDLSLGKSDGGASVAPGGTVAYTLTYANGGNRGASGVTLTETVPANTTFNSGASTAGWSCSPTNNAGSTCTFAVGTVEASAGGSVTFAVTVANPLAAGVTQIANGASIADNGANGADPVPGDNSASDTTPITGAAVDLTLTKSDGGASVAPGGTITYTLSYTNAGNRNATGVLLGETVPANTTFNGGASSGGWSCLPDDNAGSTCTRTVGALAGGGGAGSATFAVTLANPVAAGVALVTNTASISDDGSNGADSDSGNNFASGTTPVDATPDFTIAKSDGVTSIAPGATAVYTLTYANAGNQGATGVVLTETVPANATFVAGSSTAGWACSPDANAGSTCTLAIGALVAGGGNQTATFAVTLANPVPAGYAQLSNTASIGDDTTNGVDPTPGNDSATDTDTVTAAPDLSLGKSDGGASVTPGGTVAYTLGYSNGGNRGAAGVQLTETVPANATFASGSSTAGWSCAPDGNAGSTCTLTLGVVEAGANGTATFAVTAANPIPAGVAQLANTASIDDNHTNGSDPVPADNTASDTTPVGGAPDLGIAKSDGGIAASPGDTVAYTLTYANTGNRGAQGVTLGETVPANTTFAPGSSTPGWSCAPDGSAGSTCTLAVGTLQAGGGNQAATFAVTVASPMPVGVTLVSNTATIADNGANGTDPTPANDSASDTTPVQSHPDLVLAKSDGGASVAPGGTVVYTLTYENVGDGDAAGVVVTETVPANTTFAAGSSTPGWSCAPDGNAGSTCTLAVGGVAAGTGPATATFAVAVSSPVAAGVAQIANTASIADDGANGSDPTPADNSASDTTPVTAAPDLTLTKSDGGATTVPGGTVIYVLTYANAGNQDASGVVVSETVPASATFAAGASTAGWSCAPNGSAGSVCTLGVGALAAGSGNHTAAFAVTVANPVAAGVAQIANSAAIADDGANGSDPNPGDNLASDTTPVVAAPDLSLAKSDGGATVAPGGTATYTLTYANAGDRGAQGVTLTETVPAHTTFLAGSSTAGWSCAPDGNAGSTCTLAIGTLEAGSGDGTAAFAVTVDTPLAAGVSELANTAAIADDGSNGADPTPADDSASDTTPLDVHPDLVLAKSDGDASTTAGGGASWVLTWQNVGDGDATGVVLTETVPANTSFDAGASTAGWSCAPNGDAGATCTLAVGTVAAGGGPATATFAVTVASPLAAGVAQIANTASIAGTNGTDPNPSDNTASDTTPVVAAPDLSVTKSDGGASVAPGGTVAYTLSYANAGDQDATGVVLAETVPANTTFAAGSSTAGWSCAPDGNAGATCTLAIGALAAGSGTHTAVFAVTVANPLGAGVTQIANTASMADDGANGSDPSPGDDSGSDTTPVTGAPDLSLAKSDGGASAAPGDTVAYTLTYANGGTRGATGVVLTETVPANTTFSAGASTAGWSCAPNDSAGATCTLAIGGLAAGGGPQTATFAVTVANPIAAGVTEVANTASIADDGSNGVDPTPGDDTASDTTPIGGAVDLHVAKTDGDAVVLPGGLVTWTITYGNAGDRGAAGVVLTEGVPAGTTFAAGSSTAGWSCTPDGNAGSACTLAIGGLAAGGGTQTATFAATVGAGVAPGNFVANTVSIADDGTGGETALLDNLASDTTPVVECLSHGQCGDPTKPVCAANSCVACGFDAECSAIDPARPVCLASGACGQCASDAQCAVPRPLCDTGIATCVECLVNSDCGPGGVCEAGGLCRDLFGDGYETGDASRWDVAAP